MVKKLTKASSPKSTTSVKKAASKAKKEKLSNGVGNKKSEAEIIKDETDPSSENRLITENEVIESQENADSTSETEENKDVQMNEIEAATQKEPTEIKDVIADDDKVAPKSRKRKAVAAVVTEQKESTKQPKAKKRKVVLEIPKISSDGGKVFVVGDNAVGQLGFDDDITEKKKPTLLEMPHSIVDIAAGGMHSVCLTESGEVITFGCNDEGALGRITEDGAEYIPQKVDLPERIIQVSAGDSHSAALSESGQVYIWGNFRNNNGPMGLVTEDAKQVTPVRILNNAVIVKIASGNDHLSCLSDEGIVYTCGNGEAGQLGRVSEHASVDGGRRGKTLLITPDRVPVTKSNKTCIVKDIWTGSFATFLQIQQNSSSQTLYAFGLNNFNQLGISNQTNIWKPKHITSFSNRTWTQINGDQHHTLALDTDGLVYSLGRSEYGRLGLGDDTEDKSVPTAIASLQDIKCSDISCGSSVSFALQDNGSVYSWGMGTNHQLGHGNENDQHVPKLIEGNFFNSWKAFKIAGGGQHTLILAHPRNSSEDSK